MTTALPAALDPLREQMAGEVLARSDDGFEAACVGFNLANVHRPDVVVMAESAGDVTAVVRYAASAGLVVHVHATGHGVGRPADGGVLINTSRMTALEIDPAERTARAGAGVRWGAVIEAAAAHGLAPLNGSSGTVGVVGYTLGGGLGPMGRTFGYAADRVRRLQLVTADGSVVEVDAEREPELFWGLRGGKPALGVVTEIEFDLVEVAEFYGGAVFFAGDAAPEVLHAYADWVHTLPEQTTASIALLRLPDLEAVPAPLRGRLSVHLRYVHVGSETEGARLLAPMREVAAPLVDLVGSRPYSEIGAVHQDPDGPVPSWDRGVLLRELPHEAVDTMLAVAGPGVDTPLILVEVRHLGGAAARENGGPSAVGGREAAFSFGAVGPYPPPLQETVAAAGTAVLQAMDPWATGGSNVNFLGTATGDDQVRRAWSEANVIRLEALKRAWDPDGRFRFGHSLTPAT